MSYKLVTDSSCDMTQEYLRENDIVEMQLSFTLNGTTCKCNEMESKEFYRLVRAGGMPITAQVNVEDALTAFKTILDSGSDILYIAFSSGLSGTCSSGVIAAKELADVYPDRKIIVVDTLSASMGQGFILYKAVLQKKAGKSIDEIAQWIEDNKMKVVHYVAADDLMHLHRGGRVSKASALVGSALGIKPIIHVNNEGKLIVVEKVRGRKQSLIKLVDLLEKTKPVKDNTLCSITHSDCIEDAEFVADLVRTRLGIKEVIINYIGPVIGTHTGAGTVAVALMGERR